jgi:hypothetical protein
MPPSHLQKQSHTRNVSSSDADLIGNRRAVSCGRFRRTTRMSYRRRKTQEADLANALPKTERLAAISSIRLVI